MAKRKDIENLIDGIMGEPKETTTPTRQEQGDVAPEVVEALRISPEMEEQLNRVRRERVGRPKGNGRVSMKSPTGGRATFVVDTEVIRKVKYISLADSRLLKDIISEALNTYITKWEKSNGTINLPKGKK